MSIPDFKILYEDNHLIAVGKPFNVPVISDKSGDEPLLSIVKNYLKIKYNKPGNVFLGVIHRIDRPVGGLVIFAKTSKALARMNEMLKKREIKKIYLAIVENKPKENKGTLDHYLKKNSKNNKSTVFKRELEGSKQAITHYNYISELTNYHLLELEIVTGRHHQIRAQLAYEKTCIRGDVKYGAKRPNKNRNIDLHSFKMIFKHPITKEEIVIKSSPDYKDNIWKDIRLVLD